MKTNHELKVGKKITDFFICSSKIVKVDRNGKKYLNLQLSDANGRISAKMWGVSESEIESFSEHDVVKVQAVVDSGYRGGPELKIEKIRAAMADDDFDLAELLVSSPRDIGEMEAEFAEVRGSVSNPYLVALLDEIFNDDASYRSFCEAPAAKGVHHNYIHGLIEHTVAVCRIVAGLADLYPEINRDLLVCGAILHDIGKTIEFDYTTAIDYSDHGRLLGHIVIGERLITEAIHRLESFPTELELQLLHLILAHHGELEFGSPQPPQTIEAFFLHHADNIDAKANVFRRKRDETDDPWSEYDRVLQRFLYLRKVEE